MTAQQHTTWYLVADGSRARILELSGRKLIHVFNEDFIGNKLKSGDTLADDAGRRTSGHPAAQRNNPHKMQKAGFALELAKVVDKAREEHRFEKLVLIAPPEMLGDLRNSLPEQVKPHVVREINKDLSELSEGDLWQWLDGSGQGIE
jgi:protein required for attachment to host cells